MFLDFRESILNLCRHKNENVEYNRWKEQYFFGYSLQKFKLPEEEKIVVALNIYCM